MCVCPSVRIHTPCKTTGSFARARRGWLVIAWALAQLSATRRRRLPQPKHSRRTGVTGVSAPALEQRPDAEQSPTFSPPGYATSRLRPASESRVLLYATAIYRMSPKLSSVDKADRKK